MARWFLTMLISLVCESARMVNSNKDLPAIPPAYEDSNAANAPEPVEQADGKVVQRVSWDVAEDFNSARARARERRNARMAQQQAMAAKAQAEAEEKVKAAWEKNAYNGGQPKSKQTTVVHLIRKRRDHAHKHANQTNKSNSSAVTRPEPALDGLDHLAQKVAHFGEALEKFSKAQAGKGNKSRKLPPQVEKIMENAEDVMKKIIAVADDKSLEAAEVDVKKDGKPVEIKSNSTSQVKGEHNVTSNQTVSNGTVTAVYDASPALGKNETNAGTNATSLKNASVAMQSQNHTDKVAAQVVMNNGTAIAMTGSQNATLLSNMTDKNRTAANKNASNAATLSSKNATQTAGNNATSAVNTGIVPGAAVNKTSSFGHQKAASNGTEVSQPMKNLTKNTSIGKPTAARDPSTHFNKPDRMVHSALGAARLAAAKLRGMRVHVHTPVVEDDTWKFANAEIDSRIVGLKAARDDAKKADDQDLADSIQEKIKGLQAEADENKAKAEKAKHARHSTK